MSTPPFPIDMDKKRPCEDCGKMAVHDVCNACMKKRIQKWERDGELG